jgi:hypothetical protein
MGRPRIGFNTFPGKRVDRMRASTEATICIIHLSSLSFGFCNPNIKIYPKVASLLRNFSKTIWPDNASKQPKNAIR